MTRAQLARLMLPPAVHVVTDPDNTVRPWQIVSIETGRPVVKLCTCAATVRWLNRYGYHEGAGGDLYTKRAP